MGGRRSRYWCGPGIFRETKKAPVRGFIGQRSAPVFLLKGTKKENEKTNPTDLHTRCNEDLHRERFRTCRSPARRLARMRRGTGDRPARPQRLRQDHAAQPLRRDGFPHYRRSASRRPGDVEPRRCRPDPSSPPQNWLRFSVLPIAAVAHRARERGTPSAAGRREEHRSHRARAPALGRSRRQSRARCPTSFPAARCSASPSPARWCTTPRFWLPTSPPAISIPPAATSSCA